VLQAEQIAAAIRKQKTLLASGLRSQWLRLVPFAMHLSFRQRPNLCDMIACCDGFDFILLKAIQKVKISIF
jgi:hypothetical protein